MLYLDLYLGSPKVIPNKSKCFYFCRFYFNRDLLNGSTYISCFYYGSLVPSAIDACARDVYLGGLGRSNHKNMVSFCGVYLAGLGLYLKFIKGKAIPSQFSCQFKSKAQLAKSKIIAKNLVWASQA